MQKIFAYGMMRELQYDQEGVIDKMFPQIDEFVEFTSNFVEQLDQRQREHDHKDKVCTFIVYSILIILWNSRLVSLPGMSNRIYVTCFIFLYNF